MITTKSDDIGVVKRIKVYVYSVLVNKLTTYLLTYFNDIEVTEDYF